MAPLVIGFAALLGAALGSFIGVVATRGMLASLGGRSQCDSCGRVLSWYELVPLISFPLLRGRCRTCRAPIGAGAYLWEFGGAVVGAGLGAAGLIIFSRTAG